MDDNHVYLAYTIKILNMINMWHVSKRSFRLIKEFYVLVVLVSSMLAAFSDFLVQFDEEDLLFINLMQSLVAATALCSVIYTSICFMVKKKEIKRLTEKLKIFEQFLPTPLIEDAEKRAKLYTKVFILYGIIGNISYACLPLLSLEECNKHRTKHMHKYGIPCGTLARYVLPFRHDYFPLAQIIMFEEAFVSTLGTTIVMAVTMLICGIVTHVAANLKHLREMILNISKVDCCKRNCYVNFCIKYHTAIVDFSDEVNNAFSVMMLVHITWTSLIISVLGIEIIMDPNYSNGFRFTMHLGGWVGMLFLICFYGQILMDTSTSISTAVYETKWYETAPSIRRSLVLLLLRSQRPLVLKAAGVNVMSLATFLGVMYSAYSYFTLLLKVKP